MFQVPALEPRIQSPSENSNSQKEFGLPTFHFQGLCPFSFREATSHFLGTLAHLLKIVMESKCYAFRRWLDTLCSSSENMTAFLGIMSFCLFVRHFWPFLFGTCFTFNFFWCSVLHLKMQKVRYLKQNRHVDTKKAKHNNKKTGQNYSAQFPKSIKTIPPSQGSTKWNKKTKL